MARPRDATDPATKDCFSAFIHRNECGSGRMNEYPYSKLKSRLGEEKLVQRRIHGCNRFRLRDTTCLQDYTAEAGMRVQNTKSVTAGSPPACRTNVAIWPRWYHE